MSRKWLPVVLLVLATVAVGLSIPLYVVAIIGVGMSPSQPHLGWLTACLLWTPPVVCIVASISALRLQKPNRIWQWVWAVPMMLISLVEGVWTLLILLKG